MDNNSTKNKLSIGIICGFPFPVGYSGTNRVVSIARGLVANKQNTKVYIYKPTEAHNNVINKSPKGIYKGVKFTYPFGNTVKSRSKPGKFFGLVFGFLFLFRNLHKDKKTLDVILIDTDRSHLVWLITIFLKLVMKVKIYLMVDEYPRAIRIGKSKISLTTRWLYQHSIKWHNGLISMTAPLEKYYSQFIKKNRYIIVPMTVESDRFTKSDKHQGNAITYIGNFEIEKDGVDLLIKAFSMVLKTHSSITLELAGEGKRSDMDKVKNLIDSLGIKDNVHIQGRIHRDNVPAYLKKAKILAMARPSTLRNQGGFPTKLGEYLLIGKPVLVTDIGDISKYLKDSESIFLAKPGDIEDFARKLIYILENYSEALQVAIEGKKIALNNFDYIIQTRKLVTFLNNETKT